jgi:hypothetical protein
MNPTRRDLLAWGSGVTAGLFLTPVPWKLLDDTAKWTQHWPWIPQPARGPVEVKQTACTLCPQGCGLRVRMAAGAPVSLAGAPAHPASKGALCPLAFGAHQLNWHPKRLRRVLHRGQPSTWAEAREAFRKAAAEGSIAVVDARPGRSASGVLEEFARRHGSYHALPAREEASLAPYAEWSGVPAAVLGYDLENVRTVVSFGAPLLDGWGTPGRFARRWARREVRLIQIEPVLSRTAACASQWVVIRPGSEATLASGLAGMSPIETAAQQSGVSIDAIAELARAIRAEGPALAVSVDAQPAVAALSLALGGTVVQRRDVARASTLLTGSRRAVLVDATVPWEFEPACGGEVFRFAAWDCGGSKADWLLPAPGFLEELTDVPTAPASAIATYAIAAPLLKPEHEVSTAVEWVGGSVEQAIRARCEHIGADYEKLLAGDVWVDDPKNSKPLRCTAGRIGNQVSNLPHTSAWQLPVLPPLADNWRLA